MNLAIGAFIWDVYFLNFKYFLNVCNFDIIINWNRSLIP